MDLGRLLQFRTIVESGGLSRAAKLLHLSPGALSKSLRKLEEELGGALFDRSGRALELTEFGRRIYGRSEALVTEYRHFVGNAGAESPLPSAPPVRVATFEVFSTYVLGAILAHDAELRQREWRVLDVGVGEIERAVSRMEADIGVTYAPVPSRGLRFKRLARTTFGLYGRASSLKGAKPDDLLHAVPVSRIRMNAANLLAVDSWPEPIARDIGFRLTSLESALALARGGHCVVHLPDFIARLHNASVLASQRLVPAPVPRGYKRSTQWIHLVSRESEPRSPLAERYGLALRAVVDKS